VSEDNEVTQPTEKSSKGGLLWTSDVPPRSENNDTYLRPYLLTPCSTVLLKKLPGSQLLKKSQHFAETEGSLPHPQVPPTCPYPEPDQSIPCPLISIPEDPSSHLCLGLPSGPINFPLSSPPYALHDTSYHYSRFNHPSNIG